MTPMDAARAALKEVFGYDDFRPGQEDAVAAILRGRDVMAVMPTGAGKSICYQIPALVLEGVTLVVSPLISLMRDQVFSLLQNGVRAAYLNSSLTPRQYALALEHARRGTYKIIFQPAEEGEHGADEVIATGLVSDVDAFYGLHVWSLYPTGTLHATPGGIWAEPDMFKVTIHGKGGHGATPEVCVDAITAGAAVVQSLQTIVSRFISPMDSVVVTVGSFHAGTRCNIIAQDAVLEGTLRAFDDDVHRRLLEHFRRIITDVSAAYGCTAEIEINEVAGVVVNDEALCRIANECAAELVSPDRIQPQHPCMLGDDFASYRAIAPSCFVQVGMLAPEKDCRYAHHHGMFKVDEDVLPLCAAWMAAMAARAAAR